MIAIKISLLMILVIFIGNVQLYFSYLLSSFKFVKSIKYTKLSVINNHSKIQEKIVKSLYKNLSSEKVHDIYLYKNNRPQNNYLVHPSLKKTITAYEIEESYIKDSMIIDDIDKLQCPCLDFNVSAAVGKILETSKLTSNRFKPLLAIVRGMGTGKTRAIEELRLCLQLHHPEVLALPITFNSETIYNESEEVAPIVKNIHISSSQLSVAISVASRMIYQFYKNLKLNEARDIMDEIIESLNIDLQKSQKQADVGEYLLAAVTKHIIRTIEEKSDKKIKSFCLFIDETVAVDKWFKDDPFKIVRKVIVQDLDKVICPGVLL